MIDNGVEGFLVPPDNPGALAEKLRLLLLNPEMAADMGIKAQARIHKQFDQEKVIKEQADWVEQNTNKVCKEKTASVAG